VKLVQNVNIRVSLALEERSLITYVEVVPLTRTDAVVPDQVVRMGRWSTDVVVMTVSHVVVWITAPVAGRARRAALLNDGKIILSVASRRQSSRMTRTC
jgi:hypothetical protein